jgi:putative exosortase-associated protein (TIGR04073 family)
MNLKKTLLTAALLTTVGFMGLNLRASEGDGELPPIRKLSRGISNVAFGALEVVMKMEDTNFEEGGIASVTYGALKGVSYFIAREVVGVVEIVTFLIPFPGATDEPRESGWGYGPIMRPEWVVDHEHDWYNVIFSDYPPE